jgi:hypothetical protein
MWMEAIKSHNVRKERIPVLTTIVSLIVSLTLLFGGAGVTAYAAQDSLPNDFLYPVKALIESVLPEPAKEPIQNQAGTLTQIQNGALTQSKSQTQNGTLTQSMKQTQTMTQTQTMSQTMTMEQVGFRYMLLCKLGLLEEDNEGECTFQYKYQPKTQKKGPAEDIDEPEATIGSVESFADTPLPATDGNGPGPDAGSGSGTATKAAGDVEAQGAANSPGPGDECKEGECTYSPGPGEDCDGEGDCGYHPNTAEPCAEAPCPYETEPYNTEPYNSEPANTEPAQTGTGKK